MYEDHTKHISEEPHPIQLGQVWLMDVIEFQCSRDEFDDARPTESHQGVSTSMKPGSASKQIDAETQSKAKQQQLPTRHVDGKQHNENQIDTRMHIAAQTNMVDDQHVHKD